jgi:hypothetical protein
VGSFLGTPVLLVKDDESPDRFFLRAFAGGQLVEFTLAGESSRSFSAAAAQAVVEWQADAS